jgi:hypothetical protein
MAGVTLSFVADAALVARVKDIARSDGITASQAAARTSALGALLPTAARGTLRFLLTEGGVEAERQLATLVTKAIGRVGNTVLERQLLARAQALGVDPGAQSDEDLADQAVQVVEAYRREQQDLAENQYGAAPAPARH